MHEHFPSESLCEPVRTTLEPPAFSPSQQWHQKKHKLFMETKEKSKKMEVDGTKAKIQFLKYLPSGSFWKPLMDSFRPLAEV
jgi:hypothetical protein